MQENPHDFRLVEHMIARLRTEEKSYYRACTLGDDRFVGFGTTNATLAVLGNLILQNTQASAQQKAKYKSVMPVPEARSQRKVLVYKGADAPAKARELFAALF